MAWAVVIPSVGMVCTGQQLKQLNYDADRSESNEDMPENELGQMPRERWEEGWGLLGDRAGNAREAAVCAAAVAVTASVGTPAWARWWRAALGSEGAPFVEIAPHILEALPVESAAHPDAGSTWFGIWEQFGWHTGSPTSAAAASANAALIVVLMDAEWGRVWSARLLELGVMSDLQELAERALEVLPTRK